jgi:ectoine hydroxylase-related dioxygenase (phytanoyl-CoA dioxygenase family)
MLEYILRLVGEAPSQGTIASLFSSLDKAEALNAYEVLLRAIDQGLLPNMKLHGAMHKLERAYVLADPVSLFSTALPAPPAPVSTGLGVQSVQLEAAAHAAIGPLQLQQFVSQGFLHLPAMADLVKLDECLALLNRQLGTPGAIVPGGAQPGLGKLQGSITQHAAVRALATDSRVLEAVNALMGPSACCTDNLTAQIAHRFPQTEQDGERRCIEEGRCWHTDGMRRGRVHPFSLLLGVALSDVDMDWNGNLLVWPGTHRLIHCCLENEFGAIDCGKLQLLLDGRVQLDAARATAGTRGATREPLAPADAEDAVNAAACAGACVPMMGDRAEAAEQRIHDNAPPNLPALGRPLQVRVGKGDIVLLHPDLAHAGGANYGPHVRTMLYFRLKSKTHDGRTWQHVSDEHARDLWADCSPAVREAAAAAQAAEAAAKHAA